MSGAAAEHKVNHMPRVGRRMVKSAVGAGLCLVVYLLRGQQGIVFYSMIALLQCMQPDIDGSIKMAAKRMTGTLLGAAFGLIAVLDTFIGIAISIPVNLFRIPRRKRKDILFVCDADTALLNAEDKLTPYTRFELRRMLQDGAQDAETSADASLAAPDVIVDQYDGDRAVKTLEKLYEPYFWKK